LKQLINIEDYASIHPDENEHEIKSSSEFLTWFKNDQEWKLVDGRGRRDPKKAQYNDFCLDGYFERGILRGTISLFCELPEEFYCKENECFQHCCPRLHYFDAEQEECKKVPEEYVNEWKNEFNANKPHGEFNYGNVTNIYGLDINGFDFESAISCDEDDYPTYVDLEEEEIKFLSTGKININGAIIPFGKHCYNQQVNFGDNGVIYSRQIYACANNIEDTDYNRWVNVVHQVIPALFIISLIFLGLLVIHICRTQRTKLFGWLMVSAVFMLFVFYLFTCIIKLASPDQLGVGCEISGLIIQYTYMSSILWLASMSFFMWKTFRRMTPITTATQTQVSWGCQHPHYKWYALFSWGTPLIMTIITLILQYADESLDENYIKPNIGREVEFEGETCFLNSKWSLLFYFHIINAPALIANMVFFVLFMWNMLCGVWSAQAGDPVVENQNRTKIFVVMKMFFVMGISWIAELISFFLYWFVGDAFYKEVFFFQLINSLQGFVMFCAIYFDTPRLTQIWHWIQTKRGVKISKNQSRKVSRVSTSSTSTSLSNFGRNMMKKLSTTSLNTTGIELSNIKGNNDVPEVRKEEV